MKILLVNPSDLFDIYGGLFRPDYPPPLGLAYIGAVLEKAGHEVAIIDIDRDGITEEDFAATVRSGYELVGFTATTPVMKKAEKLCKVVKDNSDAITVLGGIHATLVPEECARSGCVDFVVRGEGESTIVDLLDSISGGKPYSEVKGISFRQKGTVVSTPDRELIGNIDEIPFPARHLFRKKHSAYPGSLFVPDMPIMTSRGCPHACTYCCTKKIFTYKVRYRSTASVADEIEQLIKEYKVKQVDIWDDNFTVNKNRVFEIRDVLKRRKLETHFFFPNGLRADQVDEDILTCLKDMGCYKVAFGVESGNQAILDRAKRGITLDRIEKAYALAKKTGFETEGFFVLGLPGETEQTLQDTLTFAKKIDPDTAKFHILKPFPGTEVFDQLNKDGLMVHFDYSKYGVHGRPVHRLPGLSADEMVTWQWKLYREFYLNPRKIFSLLSKMKSWGRAKANIRFAFSFYTFLKSNHRPSP